MSSAIPHVVAFLTRPLLSSGAIAPTAVSSAQLILGASLASVPSATYALTAATPPAPLLAASIGAGIPWAAWFASFSTTEVLLVYGPGFVKARLGAGLPVKDIWSEEEQGSVVPIAVSRVHAKVGLSSPLDFTTGARLRAMLLSARVRGMRREREQSVAAAAMEPIAIRIPSLPALWALSPSPLSNSVSAMDSSSDSDDSDSDYCDSDSSSSASSASSKFTSYSTDSLTSTDSAPTTPVKSSLKTALPVVSAGAYRPPFARSQAKATQRPAPAVPTPRAAARPTKTKPTVAVRPNPKKVDTTAYLYAGGVTRVMTGGVMLGARRSLTPNFFHRRPIHHSAVPHVVAPPFSPGPAVHPPHRRLLLDASLASVPWATYVPGFVKARKSIARRAVGSPLAAKQLPHWREREQTIAAAAMDDNVLPTALDSDDSDSPLRLRASSKFTSYSTELLTSADSAPRSTTPLKSKPPRRRQRSLSRAQARSALSTHSQAKATPCSAPAVPTPHAAACPTKTKPSAPRATPAPIVRPDPTNGRLLYADGVMTGSVMFGARRS
ncbi:hypothetical protein K438DRAFT_1997581 [Mycena galopus ATCC 62051]|nr:hypothetical protein K438DRAFT_1997581 [Mycena galopus ATCC 62051]